MFKKTIKFLNAVLIIILSLSIIFLVNGTFEQIIVQNKIQEFKNRGRYVSMEDNFRGTTYYYQVNKKYDYEDVSRNIYDLNNYYIGSTSDIILTNRNPMRGTSVEGIVGFLSKNYYIGHATIVSSDDGSKIIEVLGNTGYPEGDIVSESANSWISADSGDTPVIIGLRIKGTNTTQRNQIIDYARSKAGYPYNFSFLFNRSKSFYCTDLVSRSIQIADISVNYDYLATTGNDMIISKNVYIIFYREKTVDNNGNEIYSVYYLT